MQISFCIELLIPTSNLLQSSPLALLMRIALNFNFSVQLSPSPQRGEREGDSGRDESVQVHDFYLSWNPRISMHLL